MCQEYDIIFLRIDTLIERGKVVNLMELENWLTNSQVAKRIGRSRQGVLDLARDGRLRAVHVGKNAPGKGCWIFDPADVERFAEEERRRRER
jgi:hypothetical protein